MDFLSSSKKIRALEDELSLLVATPALARVEERAWTMDAEPTEQRIQLVGEDQLQFIQGSVSMRLTDRMQTVFEDADGRTGSGRLVETTNAGATIIEWQFDEGIIFPAHFHTWREILVIVTGRWHMQIDDPDRGTIRSILGPGTTFNVSANSVHAGICLERSEVVTFSIPPLHKP